jgi:hypothetical protein
VKGIAQLEISICAAAGVGYRSDDGHIFSAVGQDVIRDHRQGRILGIGPRDADRRRPTAGAVVDDGDGAVVGLPGPVVVEVGVQLAQGIDAVTAGPGVQDVASAYGMVPGMADVADHHGDEVILQHVVIDLAVGVIPGEQYAGGADLVGGDRRLNDSRTKAGHQQDGRDDQRDIVKLIFRHHVCSPLIRQIVSLNIILSEIRAFVKSKDF